MPTSLQVIVVFSGLILFEHDPRKGFTDALLVDGRKPHTQQLLDLDLADHETDCSRLHESDFVHYPMISWRTEPVSPGNVEPKIGGKHLDPGSYLLFRAKPESARTGARGAQPVGGLPPRWRRCWNFNWLPQVEDLHEAERMTWVPELGCLETPRPQPQASLVTRVALDRGQISNGAFAWIEDADGRYWIPRFRFLRPGWGGVARRKAAAEIIVWDLDLPPDTESLEIVRRNPAEPNMDTISKFDWKDGRVVIFVSNNPARRCQGRLHPGRVAGAASEHIRMLDHSQTSTVPVPSVAVRLRPKWWHFLFRNAVPQRMMPAAGPMTEVLGEWAPPAGTIDRPLCVPPR